MPNVPEARGLIEAAAVERFRADLTALADPGLGVGLAVSGGADSMAMLLLAAAAFPGRVAAATVDHGLRTAALAEAGLVARQCAALGVRHDILRVDVPRRASVQQAAREARYAALSGWCRAHAFGVLLTAHHADDQAETLLMRLNRGAGLGGMAGIRRRRLIDGVVLARPLLDWRRADLGAIAQQLDTVDDPSNRDVRHDRTHARALLAVSPWLDPARLSAAAMHLADAEQALVWITQEAIRTRCSVMDDGTIVADIEGLPGEIVRRIVSELIGQADSPVDGPTVSRAMALIESGRGASVGALKITPGRRLRIEKAPERRGKA